MMFELAVNWWIFLQTPVHRWLTVSLRISSRKPFARGERMNGQFRVPHLTAVFREAVFKNPFV